MEHGIQRPVVLSPDTDVFVLFYWDVLYEMWLKAGSANYTKYIPIHSLASDKGPDLYKVHPSVHTLTGCYYTSKVGTKQAALKVNPVDYLQGFGCSQNGPSDLHI